VTQEDQEDDAGFDGNFKASSDKAAKRCVEECAQKMSEHWDSVRIIATNHHKGFTGIYSSGRGNFYAQIGGVREWIMRQDEGTKQNVRDESKDE